MRRRSAPMLGPGLRLPLHSAPSVPSLGGQSTDKDSDGSASNSSSSSSGTGTDDDSNTSLAKTPYSGKSGETSSTQSYTQSPLAAEPVAALACANRSAMRRRLKSLGLGVNAVVSFSLLTEGTQDLESTASGRVRGKNPSRRVDFAPRETKVVGAPAVALPRVPTSRLAELAMDSIEPTTSETASGEAAEATTRRNSREAFDSAEPIRRHRSEGEASISSGSSATDSSGTVSVVGPSPRSPALFSPTLTFIEDTYYHDRDTTTAVSEGCSSEAESEGRQLSIAQSSSSSSSGKCETDGAFGHRNRHQREQQQQQHHGHRPTYSRTESEGSTGTNLDSPQACSSQQQSDAFHHSDHARNDHASGATTSISSADFASSVRPRAPLRVHGKATSVAANDLEGLSAVTTVAGATAAALPDSPPASLAASPFQGDRWENQLLKIRSNSPDGHVISGHPSQRRNSSSLEPSRWQSPLPTLLGLTSPTGLALGDSEGSPNVPLHKSSSGNGGTGGSQ